MIHKYLRSIGLSEYTDRKHVQALINDVVRGADIKRAAHRADGTLQCMLIKKYAPDIGVAACGEYDDQDVFHFDYYFPYLRGSGISTAEEISIERHAAQISYAGLVDEARVGVSLIFYMNNMIDYIECRGRKKNPLKGATLTLSALADSGTVMMPIAKSSEDKNLTKKRSVSRYRMISAAKRGNEAAIETLTLEDMDTYTAVSRKIRESDVFTLVDTYFMPNGVECDQYSVLGEIISCRTAANQLSGEEVCIMKLLCNDIYFDVCAASRDITGEPAPGRRFKGNVWMQGEVHFK